MTTRNIPFAYIHSFDGVSALSGTIKPMSCRLKTGKAAKILTLVNGVAVNASGATPNKTRYPVEQQLDIMIYAASGNAVDDALAPWSERLGKQGALGVRTPDGRLYTAPAVLDQIEIVDEGNMTGTGDAWCIVTLIFQQMEAWNG